MLGDRMKTYENVNRNYLPKRIPVIIRIDGRAFHTFTRTFFGKKWSEDFTELMVDTARYVAKELNSKFAYCQSDEISFLLTDYKTIDTQPLFNYNINKLVSISAATVSSFFSLLTDKNVQFDSRAFSVPQDDVCNYFIWRQLDATRNAIQMAGQENFSQKELQHVNCNQIQEKLFQEKKINFNDYPAIRKRGFCIVNNEEDREIPIFSQNRNYIEQFVYIRED